MMINFIFMRKHYVLNTVVHGYLALSHLMIIKQKKRVATFYFHIFQVGNWFEKCRSVNTLMGAVVQFKSIFII